MDESTDTEEGMVRLTVKFKGKSYDVTSKNQHMKMKTVMKNMRNKLHKPEATFLLDQEQVGEEELAKRFQGAKIQMVE